MGLYATESTMNTQEFRKSLQFTLKWEGGYVFDKDDPGGETKWGISKRAYPQEDIKNLSPERAASLYWRDYWVASGASNLPLPLAIAVFDTAVNCGVGRAKSFLQEAPEVGGYLERRKYHYLNLVEKNPKMKKFLNGWLNRLNDLKKYLELESAPD